MMLVVQKDQHDFLFSSFLNLIVPRLRTTAPTVIPPSQLIDEHLPRHLVGWIQRQCMLQCLTCIVGRWERDGNELSLVANTTDFRSFETKDSVLSLFEKTQRVFDVRKDSQFIEPRAKTNENPTSSETLSCFCCKLIQFDKLCDSFRKSKTL